MNSSLKGLIGFVLAAAMLDAAVGSALDGLLPRTLTGERIGLTNYALRKEADVLVLGSSRAQFQIMPSVMEPRLALRVYNAGLKGHDFLYSALLADLWGRRHAAPRAIVLTMDLESLILRSTEASAVQILGPYIAESPLVREGLYLAGPEKRFEYWSHAYRYNGKVLPILKNTIGHAEPNTDGFVPAQGSMDPSDPVLGAPRHGLLDFPEDGRAFSDELSLEIARKPFWPPKLRYLDDLMNTSARNGTRLLLVHTPMFNLSRAAHDAWMRRILLLVNDHPGVEFVDLCQFGRPREFADRPDLFSDFAHLNIKGAKVLSTMIAQELEQRLQSPRTVEK